MYVNWVISCCGSEFFCFHYRYELAGHRSKVNGVLAVLYFPSGLVILLVSLDANVLGNLFLSLNSHLVLSHGLSFGGHGVTNGVPSDS